MKNKAQTFAGLVKITASLPEAIGSGQSFYAQWAGSTNIPTMGKLSSWAGPSTLRTIGSSAGSSEINGRTSSCACSTRQNWRRIAGRR